MTYRGPDGETCMLDECRLARLATEWEVVRRRVANPRPAAPINTP